MTLSHTARILVGTALLAPEVPRTLWWAPAIRVSPSPHR
jgi:hypothetical protein